MSTRRQVLSAFLTAQILSPALGFAAAFPHDMPLTPDCDDEHDPTPSQTEGPYFTPESPLKQDFAADSPGGEKIAIGGYLLTSDCQPVAKGLVELWHADETGTYDNSGFKLRGHQFTGADGRWWFDTIVPGLYPGRTRHYHLKVQRPGGNVLTTQLYFPGEPENDRDRIFDSALLLDIAVAGNGKFGRYDFVVR